MFYKRLCDRWEHEADEAIAQQEKQQGRAFTDQNGRSFVPGANIASRFPTDLDGAMSNTSRIGAHGVPPVDAYGWVTGSID